MSCYEYRSLRVQDAQKKGAEGSFEGICGRVRLILPLAGFGEGKT